MVTMVRSLCPCGQPVNAKGLCDTHYYRLRKWGNPMFELPVREQKSYKDAFDRLFRNCAPNESGCWIWTGAIDTKGYGLIVIKGKNHRAHRFSYELLAGDIPKGLQIDHLCRVRACVNPAHLEPVTFAENMRRSRKTHCPQGHPYEGDNLIESFETNRPGGIHRKCRTCVRARDRRRGSKRGVTSNGDSTD